ncbi:MAG: hypothetical protein DRP74_02545 [Candidatus Omnitrophota bacterium]|nr:MAG: hypothetical protein DRP74_02545 [Candidatus Omnitrophota bacterium]
MLQAQNIHKVYSSGNKKIHVLKGIDFNIDKGEFFAIVGPSGAGKSTLLHILGGLDNPSDGKVAIENRDIYKLTDIDLSRLRNRKIGFVFQFYHLLSEFTVLENILLPALIADSSPALINKIREFALELLGRAGLEKRTNHFPNQLSGGERQRAAIVRALINKPDMLLCDEPTGNLDSEAGEGIISLIRKINKEDKTTVILVTHNLELGKQADKVYYLRGGVLVN